MEIITMTRSELYQYVFIILISVFIYIEFIGA